MAEVRILSHMNKDHRLAIEDYLCVYGNVIINKKIDNIKMTHIGLDHMVIQFTHDDLDFQIEKPIQFEPPLKDLSEARVKLVEMAKFAAEKRGYSHVQVADYRYPSLAGWALILTIYPPLFAYFFPSLLRNQYVLSVLSASKVEWILKNSLNITGLVFIIHFFECILILRPKLNKYRVPTDYLIEWYIAGLIEGNFANKRLDALIAEKAH